jgi:hypothetical protein
MTDDQPTGVDRWIESTTAFDRVRSVAFALQRPRSAREVSERAHVAEKTARDHLERLAEMDALLKGTDRGPTTYYPDPGYVRFREVRTLAREHDRDELVEQVAALKREIEGWQSEYGVETPAELRASVADVGVPEAEVYERQSIADDWELSEHRLELLREALGQYDRLTARPPANA